jgi:lipopolysaccharide/colanic/teichoic acid biosynthesis glycosyltransferase
MLHIPNDLRRDGSASPVNTNLLGSHCVLSRREFRVKSFMDFGIAVAALLLFFPAAAIIAAAIKISSRGPFLIRRPCSGYNGLSFNLYQFRTVRSWCGGADEELTAAGHFLKKSALDQLPNLLNVLRGEMSIIGPRPHALANARKYASSIGDYDCRHHVKPGLMGIAQIHGYWGESGNIDLMREQVRYDLAYAAQNSVWLDMKIAMLILPRSLVR